MKTKVKISKELENHLDEQLQNNFKELYKVTEVDNLFNIISIQTFEDFMQAHFNFSEIAKTKPSHNIFLYCHEYNKSNIETFSQKILQYNYESKSVY